MRALIYHRVSAADGGAPVEVGLERLRRHVEGRGWTLAGTLFDIGPRHDTVRQGYRGVTAALDAGQADVVVALALARLFPSARAVLLNLGDWLAAGRHLVAIEDLVDTTRPQDGIPWRSVLEVLARAERARHAEATTIGILRAQLARHGRALGAGRPTVAVDLLELERLYAEGLSLRQIRRHLGRGGAPAPSHGTIVNRLKLLAAAARLDREAHERAREARRAVGTRPNRRRKRT